MSKDLFKKPPLPFVGNKTKYVKYINKSLIPYLKNDIVNDNTLFVDVFGGSGIISHVLAFNFPNNKIIYNDYDNYTQYLRRDNLIKLNKILHYLRNIFDNIVDDKITSEQNEREHIFDKIKHHINKFFPNWENTYIKHWLDAQISFHGLGENNSILYNRVKKNDYDINIYNKYILPNMKIIHKDYNIVFKQFDSLNNVIFILDPPYIDTYNMAYKGKFAFSDTMLVLNFAFNHKSIYFESTNFKIMKYIKEQKEKKKFKYKLLQKSKFQINSSNTDYMIIFNL